MSGLTLSQQYMLLASDPAVHKLVPPVKQVMQTYVCGAGIAGLLLEGRLRLHENGKLEVVNATPTGSAGADLLLAQCSAAAKPKTVRKWIHDLYAHRRFRVPFCDAEMAPLVADGLMSEERRKVLFVFPRTVQTPDPAAVHRIVQHIRSGMLAQPPADDATVLLVMLLDASKLLKAYFSPYEQQELRDRLKALQERQVNNWSIVRQVRRAIDEIHVVIVTTAGM
ncbi:GOLPH3/VPS74 family protein [Paenibacillus hemerocallicola]|nr:GPP34 family phosphoprotein [Paenibacillus hemerocallicola]